MTPTLQDQHTQILHWIAYRLSGAASRGFILLPSQYSACPEALALGAHTKGRTCYRIACSICGEQFKLKSYSQQIAHREKCKYEQPTTKTSE